MIMKAATEPMVRTPPASHMPRAGRHTGAGTPTGRRRAGGQHADDEAALSLEPSCCNGCTKHMAVTPVPEPTTTPQSRMSCQELLHERGQNNARRDDRERRHDAAAKPEPLDDRRGKRPGKTEQKDVHGDRERNGRPGPAEFLLQRHQQHARCRPSHLPPSARPGMSRLRQPRRNGTAKLSSCTPLDRRYVARPSRAMVGESGGVA